MCIYNYICYKKYSNNTLYTVYSMWSRHVNCRVVCNRIRVFWKHAFRNHVTLRGALPGGSEHTLKNIKYLLYAYPVGIGWLRDDHVVHRYIRFLFALLDVATTGHCVTSRHFQVFVTSRKIRQILRNRKSIFQWIIINNIDFWFLSYI